MNDRHRVVIVGGGFGGMYCAIALRNAPAQVTIIDNRNFHLFQPLLYQVATGGLSPANIAAPLRCVLKRQRNTRVLMAEVVGFDLKSNKVLLADNNSLDFDTLVLAAGSTNHYFGRDRQWQPLAPGLKSIEDATAIRSKVLTAFENAERESDHGRRSRLLTFLVVGGGPTGVELAGAIAELAHITMKRDFRAFNPAMARIILVEGEERLLSTFHPSLSDAARRGLERLGVEVLLSRHVTEIVEDHVLLTENKAKSIERIECSTVIWAAGVKASPLSAVLAQQLGNSVILDRSGRISVAPDCTVPGRDDIFAIGDNALFLGPADRPLPGLAPVAMQQGNYVASVIMARLRRQSPPLPFRYRDKGTMATIGRGRAVAQSGGLRMSGFVAWIAWLFIHILYLARFENRVLVAFQWFWNYITRNRAARLITHERSSFNQAAAALQSLGQSKSQ